MDRHLGVSIGLSVGVVVFFAVVLYPPEKPATTAQPQAAPQPPVARPQPRPPVPSLTPGVPLTEAVPGPSTPEPVPKPVLTPESGPAPRRKRSAFTLVGAGELLPDVALRVYGTADAARTIWLANRDQLDRQDVPLHPGMLLRTP